MPKYLNSGDLFLLQILFCGSSLLVAEALATAQMTAPRAVLAAKIDTFLIAALAFLPCCTGGIRHGRYAAGLGAVVTLAAIGCYLLVTLSPGFDFIDSQPWLGYGFLTGAQLCTVVRHAAARWFIQRSANRLHRAHTATREINDGDPGNFGPTSTSAALDVDAGAQHGPGERPGHLFRGLGDAKLEKLDEIFSVSLHMHLPIGEVCRGARVRGSSALRIRPRHFLPVVCVVL
eukprot:COSAG05_NODE_14_length_36349_cov_27.641655_23_plen_232_part_00